MRNLALLLCIVSALHQAKAQAVKLDSLLGKNILQEQKVRLKNLDGKADYLIYWNMAVAYSYLGAPPDTIFTYLNKSRITEPDQFVQTVDIAIQMSQNKIENLQFYKILGPKFLELIQKAQPSETPVSASQSKDSPIVNQRVVQRLEKLLENDQKYRQLPAFSTDKMVQQKQWELDSLNALELELLYNEYGYPGKSITGDNQYQNYFAIIVHHLQSPSGKYRHWFPIIEKAYLKKELSASIFKLLLDRIHSFDTGKQFFGTQMGVPMENEEATNTIKQKYGFD